MLELWCYSCIEELFARTSCCSGLEKLNLNRNPIKQVLALYTKNIGAGGIEYLLC